MQPCTNFVLVFLFTLIYLFQCVMEVTHFFNACLMMLFFSTALRVTQYLVIFMGQRDLSTFSLKICVFDVFKNISRNEEQRKKIISSNILLQFRPQLSSISSNNILYAPYPPLSSVINVSILGEIFLTLQNGCIRVILL